MKSKQTHLRAKSTRHAAPYKYNGHIHSTPPVSSAKNQVDMVHAKKAYRFVEEPHRRKARKQRRHRAHRRLLLPQKRSLRAHNNNQGPQSNPYREPVSVELCNPVGELCGRPDPGDSRRAAPIAQRPYHAEAPQQLHQRQKKALGFPGGATTMRSEKKEVKKRCLQGDLFRVAPFEVQRGYQSAIQAFHKLSQKLYSYTSLS